MKFFKKTAVALATAAALTVAGSAHAAFLTDWTLDTNGAAAGGQILVGEYLNLVGTAYINNSFTSPTSFDFKEAGTFGVASADTGNLPFGLSSTFVGTGSGTVGASGGSLTFGNGTLNVFNSVNALIGTFQLQNGSALLQPNSVLPNGIISIQFKASSLAAGYFFKDATDLSTIVSSPEGLLFGFATTNASLLTGTTSINAALAADGPLYGAAFSSAPSLANYGTDNLVISNNGQYRLQVPEPASLALVGIALLGLGGSARRRKTAE